MLSTTTQPKHLIFTRILVGIGFLALFAFVVLIVRTHYAGAAQLNLVVTTAADSGPGSLRQAILDANAASSTTSTPHLISFAIPSTGVQTITLSSALPVITKPTVIDGLTQPGSSCGTLVPVLPATSNVTHSLRVEVTMRNVTTPGSVFSISGTAAGSGIQGLVINGSRATGLDANATTSANIYSLASDARFECNYIGTSSNGLSRGISTELAPANGVGLKIAGSNNSVRNNLISGNTLAGLVSTSQVANVSVVGNLVGSDVTGAVPLGNGSTNATLSAGGNTGIGLSGPINGDVYRNVIVANTSVGISASGGNGMKFRGNYVGVSLSGMATMANGFGARIGGNTTVVGGITSSDRNVIAGNVQQGLRVESSTGAVVTGNYLGVGADGITRLGSNSGIYMGYATVGAKIGGSTAAERNVIAGFTGNGIVIDNTVGCRDNVIQGNYIGVGADGVQTYSVPSAANGIVVPSNCANTKVGGSAIGEGNTIVAMRGNAISSSSPDIEIRGNTIGFLADTTTSVQSTTSAIVINPTATTTARVISSRAGIYDNVIASSRGYGVLLSSILTDTPFKLQGNLIGTNRTKVVSAPNTSDGIRLQSSRGVQIGGTQAGEANTITNNGNDGITVTGEGGGNTIRGNSIYKNVGLAIDLGDNGVTQNDNLDVDIGSNNLQNFPVTATFLACNGTLQQQTRLRSTPNTSFVIDYYANPSGRDSTGYGEAEQWIGSTTVVTDELGSVDFTPLVGQNVSMTATNNLGSTSEMSNQRDVLVDSCDTPAQQSNSSSPSLYGYLNVTGATPEITVTVAGQTVPATYGWGSWYINQGQLQDLPDGNYDVMVTITDQSTGFNSSFTSLEALTIDTVAPIAVGTSLTTNSLSPALNGTIDDASAYVYVGIGGSCFDAGGGEGLDSDVPTIYCIAAINNGDGTWTIPAGEIPELADGVYELNVIAYDMAGNLSVNVNEVGLTIDRTAPTGTIAHVVPSQNTKPVITGTVSESTASVRVVIRDVLYDATVDADGGWKLPEDLTFTPGEYDIKVLFTDKIGNESESYGTITVLQPPTVESFASSGRSPTLRGTFNSVQARMLRVQVSGIWYELGKDAALRAVGDAWSLDLSVARVQLPEGRIDVTVQVLTEDGITLTDVTKIEILITGAPVPVLSQVKAPDTGRGSVPVGYIAITVISLLALIATLSRPLYRLLARS